jgi:hypothetical protein
VYRPSSRGVDRPRSRHASGRGVADEDDPIAANPDIRSATGRSCAVDDGAAANENVDTLLRSRRRGNESQHAAERGPSENKSHDIP